MDASMILMGVVVGCIEVCAVGSKMCYRCLFLLNMHCCDCVRVLTPELDSWLCGRDDCSLRTNSKLPNVICHVLVISRCA